MCPQYITNYWLITDSCGDTNICSQAVTVEGCCTNTGTTNSGCCGPMPDRRPSLALSSAGSPTLIGDPSGINTNGTWMVTNLPCYGNVLITQTFSDTPPDHTYWSLWYLSPLFGSVPPGPGIFQDVQAGYGPYSWAAFNSVFAFYNGHFSPMSYQVHIYFLDGQPNPCTLYLGVVGLASPPPQPSPSRWCSGPSTTSWPVRQPELRPTPPWMASMDRRWREPAERRWAAHFP